MTAKPDALVLYDRDAVVGVFATYDDIAAHLGTTRATARQYARPSAERRGCRYHVERVYGDLASGETA